MTTFDQALAKVRANFPKAAIERTQLRWAIETASSLITMCNRYRVARRTDDEGVRSYWASTVASPTKESKHVGGPFADPNHAKDAAQRHFDNLQRELSL